MAAISACSIDAERVLACMRGRSIECDFAALIAVWSVRRPCRLVPAVFKPLGNLGIGYGWEQGKCEESSFAEHGG